MVKQKHNHELERAAFKFRVKENMEKWKNMTPEDKIIEMNNLKILSNNQLILDVNSGEITNLGGK